MTCKIACMLAVLGILTASAQAEESALAPRETNAAKVVETISADKAKTETYCKITELAVQGGAGAAGGVRQARQALSA
jgi:hypothetical protein